MVGIVGGEHHGQARSGQPLNLAQHTPLVAEVEAGGRFVQDHSARLLRQRTGHQHQLTLAARELGHRPFRELPDAQPAHGLHHRRPVAGRGRREHAAVRGATHEHDFARKKAESGAGDLRHVRHAQSALTQRHSESGAPSSSTSPARGGINPSSVFSSVVFPPPFGPSSASTSPGRSSSVKPLPTRRPG